MEMKYSEKKNVETRIAFTDLEKAFERINKIIGNITKQGILNTYECNKRRI